MKKVLVILGPTATGKTDIGLEFAKKLADEGVQTRPFFYPMHLQPALEKYKQESLPVSEKIATYGLYLPSGLGLTKEEITNVAEAIKKILD